MDPDLKPLQGCTAALAMGHSYANENSAHAGTEGSGGARRYVVLGLATRHCYSPLLLATRDQAPCRHISKPAGAECAGATRASALSGPVRDFEAHLRACPARGYWPVTGLGGLGHMESGLCSHVKTLRIMKGFHFCYVETPSGSTYT